MMTLMQMRAFVAVSRHSSFTLAADALNRSQPAITAQVKQLEEALGFKLVDRSTRHLSLTSLGAELVPVFSRMLQELDSVVETAKKLRSKRLGTVRIGCLPSIASTFLPPRIAIYRNQHPNITFLLKDAVGDSVIAAVKNHEVEFGITDITPAAIELDAAPLQKDTICAFYLAGHRLETAATVDVIELCKHDLILSAHGTNTRRMVDNAFAAQGRPALPACEAAYNSTAVGMVQAGLGVALLPPSCVDLNIDPRIRFRIVESPGFTRQIAIVKVRNRTLSPAADNFARQLLAECGGGWTGFGAQRTPAPAIAPITSSDSP